MNNLKHKQSGYIIGHGKIAQQLINKKVMDMIDEASDDYDK